MAADLHLHPKPKEDGSNVCGGCWGSRIDGLVSMRGNGQHFFLPDLSLGSQKVWLTFRVALSTCNNLIKKAVDSQDNHHSWFQRQIDVYYYSGLIAGIILVFWFLENNRNRPYG